METRWVLALWNIKTFKLLHKKKYELMMSNKQKKNKSLAVRSGEREFLGMTIQSTY